MKRHHRQNWPRLMQESHETACHFCDTVHQVQLIKIGEKATCHTCGQPLYYNRPKSVERAVSFALSGMMLFIVYLSFPYIELNAQGNAIIMSIMEALIQMWNTGGTFVAISVALFAIILPLTQLILILYICTPLLVGKTLPLVVKTTKVLQTIQPWIMIEVFFFATIVSLIKLIKLADVELLSGFWSLVGVMLCIAGALSGIDRLELWDRIELAQANKKKTPHQ